MPAHLANNTRSPALTSRGISFPSLSRLPGPDGDNLALLGLLLGRVRDDDPAGRLLFRLDARYHDPIMQRCNLHFQNLLLKMITGRVIPLPVIGVIPGHLRAGEVPAPEKGFPAASGRGKPFLVSEIRLHGYSVLTAILFPFTLASSNRGRVTVRTPFLKRASAFSVLMPSGREMTRRKEP